MADGVVDPAGIARCPAPILTDRSRFQTFQDCPRRRWWAYEWGRGDQSPAGGVAPTKLVMPLATGTYTHIGVTYLLSRAGNAQNGQGQVVETAVSLACDRYRQEIAARGLQIEDGSDEAWTAAEQVALVEGLVRAYALVRLPALLQEFAVVEVEAEKTMPLDDAGRVVWQSRADALLQRRGNGDLCVHSLKTLGGKWDRRKEGENRHDVQGLSEAAAIEHCLAMERAERLERANSAARQAAQKFLSDEISHQMAAKILTESFLQAADWYGKPVRVEGVLMDFLLKGERRQQGADPWDPDVQNGSGRWEQHSPLVRAYRRALEDPATLQVGWEYAWSHYWRCSSPHPMRRSKWYPDGQCPGDGRRHKLGDDWQPFAVWEHTDPFRIVTPDGVREFPAGVKGWVQALAATRLAPSCDCLISTGPTLVLSGTENQVCPICQAMAREVPLIQPAAGPCLPAQFITPAPYRRQAQDLEEWRVQAAHQEAEVAGRAEIVRTLIREGSYDTAQVKLDQWFGPNRRACDYPTACAFVGFCREGTVRAAEVDPISLGGFAPRVPHHQPEAAASARLACPPAPAVFEPEVSE